MREEETDRYEQFLLYPQCFLKACFRGASEGVIVLEWVKCDSSCGFVLSKGRKHFREKGKNVGNVYLLFVPIFFLQVISLSRLLTHFLIYHFETPKFRELQTTTEMWLLTHFHTMTPFDAPGKQAF